MSKVTTTLYGDLALLPLEASNIAREVLEWKTDLFITYDGTEETEQLRINARRKIFYNFFENSVNKVPSFITEYGAYDQLWAISLWMERQYIGIVSAGGTVLSCVTDIYDFRNSSLALLYESDSNWQIIEINTVGGSQLNLSTTLQAFQRAYLMPVRVGTIFKDINRASNGWNARSELGFDIVDILDTEESVPSQYDSYDFYTDQLYKAGDRYTSTIMNNTQRVDFQLGKILKRYPWTNNRIAKPFYNLFETQTEVFNFKRYLTRRNGKYRKYWEPTFEIDLFNLSTGIIADVLLVSSDGFLDWDKQRKNIAVLDKSGTWYLREIISTVQVNETTVQLNLDSALNILSDNLDTISFLGLRRFNVDIIELNWSMGGTIMETTIPTIEVNP